MSISINGLPRFSSPTRRKRRGCSGSLRELAYKQSKLMHLAVWTEIVGIFRDISSDDSCTYVQINDKVLSFPKETLESKLIHHKLNSRLIGSKIGILRCDEPTRPISIRTFNEEAVQHIKSASELVTTA